MVQSVSRGLILTICLVCSAAFANAQQYAALVMDARSGEVVYSRNADTRVHPASLTKMMTLYIVFDEIRRGRLSLDQKIRISKNAASEPPSKLGLRAGQRIELRYLIRAAAVKSANDAATALGEAVAGSETAFTRRMDAYAKAMGMSKTNFKNAHGLTAKGHLSTARDMTKLGRRLIYDFPQYYNLFSRKSTSAGIKTVRNTNRRLLQSYPGADGIKTGYTRAAGFNLVSSARKGKKRVIVAVLGGKSSASRNAEVARLMDLGFKKMPRSARLVAPARLNVGTSQVASNKPAAKAPRGSTAGIAGHRVAALAKSNRPVPRSVGLSGPVARNNPNIAAAIAEVNSELVAARISPRILQPGNHVGRPVPRPGKDTASGPAVDAGSASTFAVAPASSARNPEPRAQIQPQREELTLASSLPTGSGSGDWAIQIGAFRAKGDAERQLLTTALKDVPQLSGGLRRIEAATLAGAKVYRAQFVGLSRDNAVSACRALMKLQSDCVPIAPGT